jgi:hypothetical protein
MRALEITIRLHLLLAGVVLGCGPERVEAERACPELLAAEAPRFEHACEHAEVGPFGSLDASREAVELRNAHMLYTVSLGKTASGYAGELRFTPRATGRYGIFMVGDFALILGEGGREVCLRGVAAEGPCEGLSRAQTYDLAGGRSVELAIVDATTSTIALVVELL